MTRLEQLWQFYLEDQRDPFNLYAYSLELAKTDKEKAIHFLKQLIEENPEYIPAYYQAAILGIDAGQDVQWIIDQGIEKAKTQHNRKAVNELQALRDTID